MPREWSEEGQEEFIGGQSDYPQQAKYNQSALIENFDIARDGGIVVRNGSDKWNLTALPGGRTALQLFQLEEYIFAYTNDGDIFWTSDDGSGSWTQIYTAADIGNNYGADYMQTSTGDPFYIIPDSSVQTQRSWVNIYFAIRVVVIADANPNQINLNTLNDGGSGLNFFEIEFEYHSSSGSTSFPWTSTNTATLEAGINSSLPWTVALGSTVLNGTGHSDITITSIPGIGLTGAKTAARPYKPVYFYRVLPFIDATYNGVLSVSKFAGHLYLSLYPDDRTWTPNASDLTSDEPNIYEVDNKRIPLRKIYLQYDPDTQTSQPRLTSAQMPTCEIAPRIISGGSVGTESKIFQYEGYARHTYYALVEGEPREFIVDGPSHRTSFATQYDFYDATNAVKVSVRLEPRVQMAMEILPLDEMDIIFSRSVANGEVLYIIGSVDAEFGMDENSWSTLFNASTDSVLQDRWTLEGDPYPGIFYLLAQDNTSMAVTADRLDTNTDASIVGNELAYDSGLLQGYTAIPQGPYYFTIANQIGYYADTFKLKNRVYASIYGIPHATTALSFLDYDDGITGIDTFRDKAIVFTLETSWRMEGVKGLDGRGQIRQVLISDEFGAVTNQSIVRTNYGLFFFSRTGICYTDGYRLLRVSEQLFDTYLEWLADLDFIRGFYHKKEQKVYWSVKYQGKNYWVILHLRYGISRETPITLATGLNWLDIPASPSSPTIEVDRFDTSVCLVNETDQELLRHQSGYILKHTNTNTTDYYPDNDENVPIIFNYKSRAFSANTRRHRKWYANAVIHATEYNDAGVSFQPTSYNDLENTVHLLGSCFDYDTMQWGGTIQTWGNPDARWNSAKLIRFRRMFPEGSIRATYKQLGFTNLYVHGPDSETHGGADYALTITSGNHRTIITIPISLATAALEMESLTVDSTGAFAIMLPDIWGNKAWFPIHKVVDNTTEFDVYIEPDTDASTNHSVLDTTWSLGYIRTEERIGIDNFNIRFAMIGEYTDGAYEADGEGGPV